MRLLTAAFTALSLTFDATPALVASASASSVVQDREVLKEGTFKGH